MAITDKHPKYTERLGEYIQMADTYAGERAVKAKRLDYLPAQEGMVQDGMQTPTSPGWKDYEAYLLRAYYHDVIKDAVKAMIGVMHEQDAEIKLPNRLKSMLLSATAQGEGLQSLLRRINVAQLTYGRLGLLAEVPIGTPINETVPYISFYDPQRIINWDAGDQNEGANDLDLVVLDESGYARKGFNWKTQRKYRILARGGEDILRGGEYTPAIGDPYGVCVKIDETSDPLPEQFIVPHIGGKALNKIPFVIIGANDLVLEPEVPPLLGLSNLALAIYRGEADYRQTLYMQGQNTLVIIGGNVDEADENSKLRVGAKGVIDLKVGGDAKYIGVSAAGLGEMRQSLKNDQDRAAREGVAFLEVGSDTGSSGEALRIRTAARTTTVNSIAKAGGAGLESILRICAEWVGEDPDEVSVKPYTDFADQTIAGAALLAFMQAKQLGLPLSLKSMHRMMKVQDMTEMDFEDEQTQIEEEAETMLGMMVGPQLAQQGVGDEFLNDGQTTPPAAGAAPAQPGSTAPPNKNTPVKPHARAAGHTRGSPVPLKRKGTHKGASANK